VTLTAAGDSNVTTPRLDVTTSIHMLKGLGSYGSNTSRCKRANGVRTLGVKSPGWCEKASGRSLLRSSAQPWEPRWPSQAPRAAGGAELLLLRCGVTLFCNHTRNCTMSMLPALFLSIALFCIAASAFVTPIMLSDRKLRQTLCIFLAAGALFTLINLKWPIARNALCYAKATLGIIEHHFNLFAVAKDRAWTSGKPIFFTMLAAPFVWLFNANTGTIIASLIGSAFFLWMTALALPRLNRCCGLDPSLLPLELVLVAFNPLVIYQFWSAYPDSLFAGLVLLAFILTDIIATEPERDSRWYILGLGVTIYLAIHTKLYGAVLLLTCPLYILLHVRLLVTRSTHRGSKIGILAAVFGALALMLVATKLGMYPLLDFADGAGFASYEGGLLHPKIRTIASSFSMLGFAIMLAFQAALLFLTTRVAWRTWALAPTVFAALYLLGLLTFPETSYNMRYFLPAFPFLAPALAAGFRSIRSRMRRTILRIYGAIALVLVLAFNLAPVQPLFHPIISTVSARHGRLSVWLDNLRLPVHIAIKKQIDAINAEVPQGSMLYWASAYYETATHGLAEHLGVKKGLEIRYVLRPSEIQAPGGSILLTAFTAAAPVDRLWQAPRWATVKSLGHGLFRLDPIRIEVVPVSGDYVAVSNPIRLQAKITLGDRLKVNTVEFIEGEKRLSLARDEPFELNWQDPPPGRHEIAARVGYGERDGLISEPVVVYVGTPALERKAHTMTDLAWERQDGLVRPAQGALEIAADKGIIGIHFDKIDVPQGMRVAKAYLELTAARPESQPTTLDMQAELSGNAPGLKFEKGDLSRRQRTAASVKWEPSPWTTVGEQERSPNLAPILEEVFAQTAWQSGNAVVLLIQGAGQRAAQSPDQDRRGAPKLYIKLQQK